MEKKTVSLIVRGIALLLLVVAFLCLFIEGNTTYEKEKWGVSSSYSRVDLDSEYSTSGHNFFTRMDKLSDNGFSILFENLLIVSFVLSLGALILSAFIKFFGKIPFSFLPLLVVVFSVIVLINNDTWFGLGSADYLGRVLGYSVYEQTFVKFELTIVPTMVVAFLSFALMLTASILDMKNKKKTASEEMVVAANSVIGDEKSNICDELAKYEDLLSRGIITQEEFDAKRKKILEL